MSQDFNERRQYHRIYLRAYAFNQKAEVRKAGQTLTLGLVDISAGGARLVSQGDGAQARFAAGETLTCTIPGVADQGALRDIPCEVRWVDAAQVGVCFLTPLTLSSAELQQIFSL